jgi:hypothetical protein
MANGIGSNAFSGFTPSTWWGEVLEESEPAQYYSSPTGMAFGARRLPGGGYKPPSPRKRRFFESSYNQIYNDYLSQAGQAMRQGRAPASFREFLLTDPFTSRYARLPQSARGVTGQMSRPRTRFLYNF